MSPLSERLSSGWRRAAASPSGARHPKSPCMWAACLSVTACLFCVCVYKVVDCSVYESCTERYIFFFPLSVALESSVSIHKRLKIITDLQMLLTLSAIVVLVAVCTVQFFNVEIHFQLFTVVDVCFHINQ